jgi:hypothetical protein
MRTAHEVDYLLWLCESTWSADDAAWLIAGHDPRSVPPELRDNLIDDESEPRERLRRDTLQAWRRDYVLPQDVRETANEAARIKALIGGETIDDARPPAEWIATAKAAGVPLPELLEKARKALPKNGDDKKREAPPAFVEALKALCAEIEKRANGAGLPFDAQKSPAGKMTDFRTVASKFDAALDTSKGTFDDYLGRAGIFRFEHGKKESDFYRTLFPEYF